MPVEVPLANRDHDVRPERHPRQRESRVLEGPIDSRSSAAIFVRATFVPTQQTHQAVQAFDEPLTVLRDAKRRPANGAALLQSGYDP
jgi:hypothetical protein